MFTALKLFALTILVGSNTSYWGHTYLAEGNDKIYALRSLSPTSSLCVFDSDVLKGKQGIIELSSLQVPMVESQTEGDESCHITLLPRQAVVSDYTSGTLTLYPLDKKGDVDGETCLLRFEGSSVHPTRQKSSHIHSSALSPDGNSLVVIDLGCDNIYRYTVKNGRLVPSSLQIISTPSGSGPRFSTFSKDGNLLYVVTELSDEVLVYSTSDFSLLGRYPLGDANPGGGSHIALSTDGRYLYASLRVSSVVKSDNYPISDGVAIYECLADGKLKRLFYQPTGGHPRHFALSADGQVLAVACRDDNVLEIYQLDKGIPTGKVEKVSVEKPVYVDIR